MNRILGIVSAAIFALLILVPVVAAAGPSRQDNHLVLNTGGDITLAADQHVDLLVVIDGTATIQGEARGLVVINGAANFVGGRSIDVFAFHSRVTLDAASVVSGDIRTIDSAVQRAAGSSLQGSVIEG